MRDLGDRPLGAGDRSVVLTDRERDLVCVLDLDLTLLRLSLERERDLLLLLVDELPSRLASLAML